ncbi:FAD binding domain protein [Aspergillus californicus]
MAYLFQLAGLTLALLSYTNPAAATANFENVDPTTEATCACRKLAKTYHSRIITPASSNYTAQAVDAYWDVRAALSPACIFLPNTPNELSVAMKIIGACDAQFAVRGGGHMSVPGSNNIDGGVVLALENFTDLKVHRETVEVGPGLTWYDVYTALEPTGRVAIGGRLKTIGVPGLTLIGGFHYFNNKYGFAMDNVLAYDVVLANGTQVTATKSTHSDLFWALKGGGGNNFGIVTRFVLKTFAVPQGKVSTTIQMFNESAVPGFLAAVVEAAKVDAGDGEIAAGMVATVAYNTTTKVTSATLLGVQEGVSTPPSQFRNFSAISTVAVNNVTTMRQWAGGFDTPMQMFRILFAHKTIKADAEALVSLYEAWKEALEDIADIEGLSPTFVPNVISPAAARIAKTNGIGNVWGLEDEPLMIWQFATSWTHARDDLRVESWSRLLLDRLHAINQEKGIASEFVYMGDAGDWQDPFAGFPAENVARLRSIQDSYDPVGVFTRLNWGGFTL